MKRTILQKAAAAALFVLLTAALLAAADFLLVDDVHSYSRSCCRSCMRTRAISTPWFLGSGSHCYRSVDPARCGRSTRHPQLHAGSSQRCRMALLLLREAAAENDLKTVYLEMFYTGYNESRSANVRWPATCLQTT